MSLISDAQSELLLEKTSQSQQGGAAHFLQSGDTASQATQSYQSYRPSNVVFRTDIEDINLGQNTTNDQQQYNSEKQRAIYENQSQSFNDQRQNYTEKSFDSYNYESNADDTGIPKSEGTNRIKCEGLMASAAIMLSDNEKNVNMLYDSIQINLEKKDSLEKKQPSINYYSIKKGRFIERKLTEDEYKSLRERKFKRDQRMARGVSLLQARQVGRLIFDDKNMKEDKDSVAVKMMMSRSAYKSVHRIKKSIRNIQDKQYIYNRLKIKDENSSLFNKEKKRLEYERRRLLIINEKIVSVSDSEKAGGDDRDARRAENRKIQQRNKQRRRLEQEINRIGREATRSRMHLQDRLNKISQKEKRIVRKRNTTIVSSAISIIATLLLMFFIVVLFLLSFFNMFAHIETKTVSQNDYTVLTDVTEYLRNLETNIKKEVTEDRTDLEEALDERCFMQTGHHVYEFVYDLPEFAFNDITLMAYLSSKFFTFDLQAVQEDLDELCALMYQKNIEFKEEERTFYDALGRPYTEMVIVCYIAIQKTELEEVVEERLDVDALEQYRAYKISSGGQQIYGPVMDGIDWGGKISSGFGERVHPITGKKTFHDGVDIAIPVGTELYSAVTGEVVKAYYSDSGGYMVTVRTDTGWEVTYMHMDNFSVTAGQIVLKGQFVGCSGNTGNSTGPHLHIRVHDAEGRSINPIFIIPQNGSLYN